MHRLRHVLATKLIDDRIIEAVISGAAGLLAVALSAISDFAGLPEDPAKRTLFHIIGYLGGSAMMLGAVGLFRRAKWSHVLLVVSWMTFAVTNAVLLRSWSGTAMCVVFALTHYWHIRDGDSS